MVNENANRHAADPPGQLDLEVSNVRLLCRHLPHLAGTKLVAFQVSSRRESVRFRPAQLVELDGIGYFLKQFPNISTT